MVNFILIRGKRYIHLFYPPYILVLFIPALVNRARVTSNWVNRVVMHCCHDGFFWLDNNDILFLISENSVKY